jgi:hypothetical protein
MVVFLFTYLGLLHTVNYIPPEHANEKQNLYLEYFQRCEI